MAPLRTNLELMSQLSLFLRHFRGYRDGVFVDFRGMLVTNFLLSLCAENSEQLKDQRSS